MDAIQRAMFDAAGARISEIRASYPRYRGYTIEPTGYGGYMFYPEDNYYFDGEHDNAGHASSIEAAKAEIDERIYEQPHVVVLHEGEKEERRYEFDDFASAYGFAVQWNGNFYPNGQPIINP